MKKLITVMVAAATLTMSLSASSLNENWRWSYSNPQTECTYLSDNIIRAVKNGLQGVENQTFDGITFQIVYFMWQGQSKGIVLAPSHKNCEKAREYESAFEKMNKQ